MRLKLSNLAARRTDNRNFKQNLKNKLRPVFWFLAHITNLTLKTKSKLLVETLFYSATLRISRFTNEEMKMKKLVYIYAR